MSVRNVPSPLLARLIHDLEAAGPSIDRHAAASILGRHPLELADVAAFVAPSPQGYARRRVRRTEHFELLVMTWLPGQGSVPHDHARSLCALRIVRGRLRESTYAPGPDGRVERAASHDATAGEVLIDTSDQIHALESGGSEPMVTVHVYAPPLPELRRYARRTEPPAAPFARARRADAKVVAVLGGGFSGVLAAAHLLRGASAPIHVTIFDRQAAPGEGPAYRTADPRHVLNVPAAKMSAWPDRPDDFVQWARGRDPAVRGDDFLPRASYGEYVRTCLHRAALEASSGASAEVVRTEVSEVRRADGRWRIDGRLDADAIVLATGHRPPDDPLRGRWTGPRARYVDDPWASLALSAIGPDEEVVLLGSSLTAIDVLLTLTRSGRTAPVLAISRRGRLPASHATEPRPPIDPSAWLTPLLSRGPTVRELVRAVRAAAADDPRPVIDGLRPHTAAIWRALGPLEAARFLRHVRAHWEVHRHRMAPQVAAEVHALIERGLFHSIAARLVAAHADDEGVTFTLRRRGQDAIERRRTCWVINCTGPGTGSLAAASPLIRSLVEGGHLEADPLALGVRTDREGRALVGARVVDDLVVLGTLRKPECWESTAVPELRVQAAAASRVVLETLASDQRGRETRNNP